MKQYIIQTKNSLYGLKIDKGKFMMGKLLEINESPEIDIGDAFHGDRLTFNWDGTISLFDGEAHKLTTSAITNMNLIQKK